jgi:ABC-type antimicrobial peptide transport system permease subunit
MAPDGRRCAGLALCVVGGGLIAKSVFGVGSIDAPVTVTVAAVLLIAAVVAAFLPARRAISVNPVETLR